MTDSTRDEIAQLINDLGPLASHVHDMREHLRDFEDRIHWFQSLLNVVHLQGVPPDPDGKRRAHKSIRDFTCGAQHLTIIDPYVFSGERRNADRYAEEFGQASRLDGNSSLKRIHFVYDPDCVTKTVRKSIRDLAHKCGVTFTDTATAAIHDRVWIKDDAEAIVTGTSFNGLGGRLSFLLPLPDDDLTYLKAFLKENRLLPGT
jgi:hypothetical protein